MINLTKLCFGLLLYVASAESNVITIASNNFTDFIQSNQICLVKFKANWCAHCKALAPAYEEAAKELKTYNIPAAEIEGPDASAEMSKYNINGYPTMLLFINGSHILYDGGREASEIVEFAKRATKQPFGWINSLNDIKNANENKLVYAINVNSKTSSDLNTIRKIAEILKFSSDIYIYVADGPMKLTIYRPDEHEEIVIDKIENLEETMKKYRLPLFGPISGKNFLEYSTRAHNWVWFAGNSDDFKKVGERVRKVSTNNRFQFNFVWINSEIYAQHVKDVLNVTDSAAFVVTMNDNKYYPELNLDTFKTEDLETYIKDVVAGKFPVPVISEDIPETQDGPVYKLVAHTFNDIVLQDKKDVFVLFYAPWCGHCKSFAPTWEELAKKLKNNHNILIADIDATANKVNHPSIRIDSFPTIMYFRKGQDTPTKYSGSRKLESLMEFIKEEATFNLVDDETNVEL